jgi:hypothetical protein
MRTDRIARRVIVLAVMMALACLAGCGGSGGKGNKPFAGGGVSYAVPAGWTRADPFTTRTPYWSHLWYHDSPSYGVRVALLQSPAAEEFQIMLLLGNSAELSAKVKKHLVKYDTHPLVDGVREDTVTTADGVAVHVRIARMAPGVLAGKDVTYLLGFADVGDRTFVLNGGGLTRGYDAGDYRSVIQSLRLRG